MVSPCFIRQIARGPSNSNTRPTRGNENAPPSHIESFKNVYENVEDALAAAGIRDATLVGEGATSNDPIAAMGYGRTEYYQTPNGTQYTIFQNSAGQYAGVHVSGGW